MEAELKNIPVKEIDLGDRARQKYEDLEALAHDIKTKGLIQPIAVQRIGEGKYRLLAGGRRFTTCTLLLDWDIIPARIYPGDLDELDRREIELMENLSRKALLPLEQAELTKQIHELQIEKFGEAAGPSEGHSAADTAKMLGKSPMSVGRDLKLANAPEDLKPQLEQAPNQSAALRILDKHDRTEENKKAVAEFERKSPTDDDEVWERRKRTALMNGYICADFFEGVQNVPAGAVSLAEIDPPYGIDLKNIKDRVDDSPGYHEVDEKEYPEFLRRVFSECWRVMMGNSWLLCWCGTQWFQAVVDLLQVQGFKPCVIPAIWNKNVIGQTRQPEIRLSSSYEMMVYAQKGNPQLSQMGRSNVFSFKPMHANDKVHVTERPVELITEVLQTFTQPNSNIMVPFLGSGNTLLAASNAKCSAFGFDLCEEFQVAYKRRAAEGELGNFTSYRK